MALILSSVRTRSVLLALSVVVALTAALGFSATEAVADSSSVAESSSVSELSPLAAPACSISADFNILEVVIDGQPGDLWAIRAIENNTDEYNFLGRTRELANTFVGELSGGEYTISARAIDGLERSTWTECGSTAIDDTPLAAPRICGVNDVGGRNVDVRIGDGRTDVIWAVRAIEADTGEYVFLGRTTSLDNSYEDPYSDGRWLVSVRAISGDQRSDWLFCGFSQLPFDPPPAVIEVGCTAVLRPGGEILAVTGSVFEDPPNDDLPLDLVFSAVNSSGDYVYYGRFTNNEAEFLELDATLLDPGTWTLQARWIRDDGTRGPQVACDTFTRVGNDPVVFACQVRPIDGFGAFVDVTEFNGPRGQTVEFFVRGENGELIRDSDARGGTQFINLTRFEIGESVDILARPVADANIPEIEPVLCGTTIVTGF